MGIIGVIFGVSALVLGGFLIWDSIKHPDYIEPAGPVDSESVDTVIALCNAEYAFSL